MNAPTPHLKLSRKPKNHAVGPARAATIICRARAAIAEADTIIGYVTYIRLVADLRSAAKSSRSR
jgi:precorrin-3B C17-methyltransferase